MKILAICLGRPEILAGKKYKTGINKLAISGPVMLDAEGLVGDAILNRKHHGGVDQAVYIQGSLDIDWWSRDLGRELHYGMFGENLVISDLESQMLAAGDRFAFGDILLEITSPRMPCATFAAHMGDPKIVKRYTQAARPGAYARVLQGGMVEAGQPVTYTAYVGERVTMADMMATYGRKLSVADRARYLSAPVHYKTREAILAGEM
ncbi:molybdenum cofactor biosysynthesis protein [Rhizobium sp. Root274]|uniref:MOSC domain-containing protein n=1 Tax=unclassified Rhizobium TaxID=2613769 RepID=UPI000714E2BD|nr:MULTISPECIES: MOSC domain-containing protein [unclassified Rhizobium]KQW32099.1 molybdenum cofactor biosysynthesis protein [Rhizobium sp. Root1240]KRD33637.1 molybdenum cofactor biosysynthesis protein [Rhizobium sp. Root274]